MCVFLTHSQTIGKVSFSLEAGIYEESQTVNLSTSSTSKIFYTIDGADPSSGSLVYTNPLKLENPTVIKAVTYLDGKRSEIATQSYIVGRKISLPVVSISTHTDNFFSWEKGIYVKGCCSDSSQPYKGANFWRGWERPITIEYFVDGKLAFNQKAGVRIFGGFSKGLPMKSLTIVSRKKYEKKYFEYPIFKEKKIKKYKSFILRNSGGDFNKTHFRDALITQLTKPTNLPIQAYQPVVVFINGEYWGIHNAREKLNEYYLKGNFKADPDSVTIMKHRNDIQVGERKHYKELLTFLRKSDLTQDSIVRKLDALMNIDNYLDYNIIQVYADNQDAGGNIRYWRPLGIEGRWNWILFDTDMSMGIADWKGYKNNTLTEMTVASNEAWPNPAWATFIIRKLLENDSIKDLYITKFNDYLNTIYSAETVLNKIDLIKSYYDQEMPFHQNKWGSKMERWERNVNVVKDFAANRPAYLRAFLKEKFELGDTVEISIKGIDPDKFKLFLNGKKIKTDFTGSYFTGHPIELRIEPNLGYKFGSWGEIEAKADNEVLLLSPKGPIQIRPSVIKKKKSNHNNKIIINEVGYKFQADWVELYNRSDSAIDLKNWKLYGAKKSEGLISFTLNKDEHVILTNKKDQLLTEIPSLDARRVIELTEFKIKKNNVQLILLDAENLVVDSLMFIADTSLNTLVKEYPNLSDKWLNENQATPNQHNPAESKKRADATRKRQYFIYGGLGFVLLGLIFIVLYRRNRSKSK